MPRVDFLISNPGHHVAAVRPVLRRLAGGPEVGCRVVSLCEFRGFRTPRQALADTGAAVVPVLSWPPRRPAGFSGGAAGGRRGLMGLLRSLSWWLLLAPALARAQRPAADLVVTPNDSAFPYNRIMAGYRRRRIPALLMQEGIRFPLPAQPGPDRYGTGGATAIAAWGQTSGDYFRAAGVPPERIHVTGSPRYDDLRPQEWVGRGASLREKLRLGGEVLLLASNPIDDQGFCTTEEKLALLRRFLTAIEPLFERPGFHLVIKLHGREDPAAFASLAAGVASPRRVTIARDEPLYALLTIARAVIVLASTVGLEALVFDRPLGVLEIPGWGFAHDYVSSGAALGLAWDRPMTAQVEELCDNPAPLRQAARTYLERNLTARHEAAERVSLLIRGLIG